MEDPTQDEDDSDLDSGGRALVSVSMALLVIGLIVVVVVGFVVVRSLNPRGDGREGEPEVLDFGANREAMATCARHAGATRPPDFRLDNASYTSAGNVTTVATAMTGRPLPPWDTLPKAHRVVRCVYLATESDEEPSPTTVCPDGESYDLRLPVQVLVDEDGRTSPDVVPPFDTCPG